jgi:hypothetical protein
MKVLPLSIARARTRFGRRAMVGGLLLALAGAAAASAAGPAAAAPLSGTAAVQQSTGAGTAATTPPSSPLKITWSILPATATGPDKSRTRFDYGVLKPGSTVTDHVEIVNDSKQSAAFSIYGTDAAGTTARGALLLLAPQKKPTDIGSWVRFPGGAPQLSTIIQGGAAVITQFTVQVPLQATPGDHTGAVVAQVGVSSKNGVGETVTENYRIAVPLELRVSGALRASLQVQSISTGFSDPLNPFGTGSATVSYTIANTGNVRQAGSQTVMVTGPFGQKLVVKPPQLPTILPGDSIRVTTAAKGLFPDGPMTAKVDVKASWPANTIALSQVAPDATGTASLFAFPWSILVLLLLIVAIGAGIGFYFRWRRRIREAELLAVAARARRDTEQRLLGGRTAANGHSGNGHSANDGGTRPPANSTETRTTPAAAPGRTPDGGGPAPEGTTK